MNTTFTATADQIQTLAITAPTARVRVIASEETTTATLEISGPAETVRDADVALHGGMWSLVLPSQTTAAGGTVTNTANGTTTVFQSGSGMVVGSGTVIVNGVRVSGTVQQSEPVTVTAHVPRNIRLSATVDSGSLRTLGYLREVAAWATSGTVYVADAGAVQASATSGDITVSHVDTTAVASSTSGDVDVRGGTDIQLSTSSGDIGFASGRACRLTASSTSGDITLVRSHDVQATVSTTSGDICG